MLVRRDAYDRVGGHAAVATEILEDVALAKRVKQSGGRLQFRVSDVVSTRMYRTFPQMWEGWTKNLALLFPHPRLLALLRLAEFLFIFGGGGMAVWQFAQGKRVEATAEAVLAIVLVILLTRRIRRAHFDWLSNVLAIFGLPLFAVLLLNSDISHNRGRVRWKGREYAGTASKPQAPDAGDNPSAGTYN